MFDAAAAVREMNALRSAPVSGLSCDSRRIEGSDCAFAAYPGHAGDGRRHIADALSAGAAGVFWEPEGFLWPAGVEAPNVPVPDLAARAGALADEIYAHPSGSLFAAAVTATNGKTTVTHLAAQLLEQSGVTAGVCGTLGAGVFGGAMEPLSNTTPDAASLHRILRDFAAAGAGAAFLEASSHGLAQSRLSGVRLSAAALINIGRDHLDYHGGMEEYRRAKSSLLLQPGLPLAVVNADDEEARSAARGCQAPHVWSFGREGGVLRLLDMKESESGCELRLRMDEEADASYAADRAAGGMRQESGAAPSGEFLMKLPFRGRHNADNFMAALLLARAAGGSWDCFRSSELALPAGRLQRINPGGAPAVYVDYAHTPDALSAALSSFAGRRGRLWTVFGCGGDRDAGKRALMGRTAAALSDVAIVTDDNPRGEDPARIRAQVMSGASGLREVADRGAAIEAAICEAAEDDAVVIAGKGHEEYQESGGVRRRFSDAEFARRALSARSAGGRC